MAAFISGCASVVQEQREVSIPIRIDPEGGDLSRNSWNGLEPLGKSPYTLRVPYEAKVRRFNHWWWLGPGISAVTLGTGIAIGGFATGTTPDGTSTVTANTSAANRTQTQNAGAALAALSILSLMVFLPVCIYGEYQHGSLAEQPRIDSVFVTASMPGYLDQIVELKPLQPGSGIIRLAKSERAAGSPLVQAPAAPQAARGDIVAVFDVQDSTGTHRADTLESLSEYLATKVTESGGLQVVPRSQIRARLVTEKTASYKECYEQACQIELGKAVAARKSLSTRLLRIGERCVLTATLYDLKSESAERAASAPNDCTPEGLLKAVDSVASQLGGARGAP